MMEGDFVLIVGMPRRDDGVGYNKGMQKRYREIGWIAETDQTINNYSEKDERNYLVSFPTGRGWWFWQKNLQRLDIKTKPKKKCLECEDEVKFRLFKRKCDICRGILCSDCKDLFDKKTRICNQCTEIKNAAIEKNEKVIQENLQSNKKAEIVIIMKDGDEYKVNLKNDYYDNVKKEFKKLLEKYKNKDEILEWNSGITLKKDIRNICIVMQDGKKGKKKK